MADFTPPVQEHVQDEGDAPFPPVRPRRTREDEDGEEMNEDEELSLEEADRQLKQTIVFLNSALGNTFE